MKSDLSEDAPKRESMNPAKRFGPHWYKDDDGNNRRKDGHLEIAIKTAERLLLSSVGLPWDEIYPKVKKIIPTHYDYHGLHLGEERCFIQDNRVYNTKGKEVSGYWAGGLYVDEQGILRRFIKKSHKWQKPKKAIVDFDKRKFYRHNGIWWEVETKPNDTNWFTFMGTRWGKCGLGEVRDVFYGYLTHCEAYRKYGEAINIVKRQQCGKRLCKKLNALGEKNE